MTTAPASQGSASPGSLFGQTDLASALETSGVADVVRAELSGFTPGTRNQAVREVERITGELTDLNPLQIMVDALSSFHELREAGRRTIGEPDCAELVELIDHQVTFQHQPSIDVVVDGKQVAVLPMLVSLVLDIQALTAVVRTGRLTALQIGRCDVTGSVAIEGRTIASRTGPMTLPASIPLGAGVPLAGPVHDQRPHPSP